MQPTKMTGEKILCAAIYWDDGQQHNHQPVRPVKSGVVVCGYRHCDCFAILSMIGRRPTDKIIQGYLTSRHRFVNREDAAIIAFNARQIEKETVALFSEDLY